MRLDIRTIPKQIHPLKETDLTVFYETMQQSLQTFIISKERSTLNTKKSCKQCLLLISFLQRDKSKFEQIFQDLVRSDKKVNGIATKYFDLRLLFDFDEQKLEQHIDAMNYDQLLRIYFKWQLLLENVIIYKYNKAIAQALKCDYKVKAEHLLNLFEFLIDWTCRMHIKDYFLKAIRRGLKNSTVDDVFWESRNYQLPLGKAVDSVKVAVWETGVEATSIKNLRSDLGLSYDQYCQPSADSLLPLKAYTQKDLLLCKGWNDLKIGKNTKAVTTLLTQLSTYNKEELLEFNTLINYFVLYAHGTTVTSVITADHPSVEIVPIRVTFDPNFNFPTYYTLERAKEEVKMYHQIFNSIKQHKVRIVNMSWVYSKNEIETSLINTGMNDEKIRTVIRDEVFDLLKTALHKGIKDNPDTLFLAGAGNSNESIDGEETIPASFDLPNLLSVGAVNRYGQRTSFTCIGKKVHIYANGAHISCMAPGRMKVVSSGTSFAAPNVANLAAKLLAVQPSLTTQELRQLVVEYADSTTEGILVINPKKSIECLLNSLKRDQLLIQ